MGGTEAAELLEVQALARLVKTQVGEIKNDTGREGLRPQHAKHLAVTRAAQFVVAQGLPHDLQVGFLIPGASYVCSVRFSNAGAMILADSEKDLRGCALKVTVADGKMHDFLMTNAEIHHAKTAVEAMWASYGLYRPGKLKKLRGIIALALKFGPATALRIVGTLSVQVKRPIESLATESYWSRSPYRFGSVVGKFRLAPDRQPSPVAANCNDLTEELCQKITQAPISFGFEIQRYADEATTPLEDSTQAWSTAFERVATLTIPQGANLREFEAVEALVFNPWTVSGEDFEPLGNMNRARRQVYAASAAARRGNA